MLLMILQSIPLIANMFTNSVEINKFAAFSVVLKTDHGVTTVIGNVSKHSANPLFIQDKPWEWRVDNGYPNVMYNEDNPDSLGKWRIWYGDCAWGCNKQILLFANSSDGIVWHKPDLGVYDIGNVRPDLKHYGKHNNAIMDGGGIGVYFDPYERDVSRRFKAFGEGCFGSGGNSGCVSGTGVSADGIHWTGARNLSFPKPQKYDCHSNLFFDQKLGVYLGTTRDVVDGQRAISRSQSAKGNFDNWPLITELVDQGTIDHQLYSQITFPYYNAYLGIIMVFDAKEGTTQGHIHCRLSWSGDSHTWHWVDEGGLEGKDFIPLGSGWTPVLEGGHSISDCAAYRNGSRVGHRICTEPKTRVADQSLNSCRKTCLTNASCGVMQWQGLKAYNYDESHGQCHFYSSCEYFKDYSNPDFCMEIERWGGFDSHICFAAATPIQTADGVRVYYMGGDGPHGADRNSSMGLITLRPDGFAGLQGTGNITTIPIRVTGKTLIITTDVSPGGSVIIGVIGASRLRPSDAIPILKSGTDFPVSFHGRADFTPLLGHNVTLRLVIDRSTVYTFGFRQ